MGGRKDQPRRKKNINYYQTTEGGALPGDDSYLASKGGENTAEDTNKTDIVNMDKTGETYEKQPINHYNIDDQNKQNIVQDVKNTLE